MRVASKTDGYRRFGRKRYPRLRDGCRVQGATWNNTGIFTAGYKRNAAGNLIQRIPAVSWMREAGSGGGHLGTPLLVICRWEYKYETWDHWATYGSAVTSPPMRCRSSDTRVCTDAPRICAPMCMRACMPNARGCLILTVCCEKNMLGKCSGWKWRIHGKRALIRRGRGKEELELESRRFEKRNIYILKRLIGE